MHNCMHVHECMRMHTSCFKLLHAYVLTCMHVCSQTVSSLFLQQYLYRKRIRSCASRHLSFSLSSIQKCTDLGKEERQVLRTQTQVSSADRKLSEVALRLARKIVSLDTHTDVKRHLLQFVVRALWSEALESMFCRTGQWHRL